MSMTICIITSLFQDTGPGSESHLEAADSLPGCDGIQLTAGGDQGLGGHIALGR